MTDSIRLAKRIAELRSCSRREAEQIITGGWVRVDGNLIEEPQFRVNALQHIEIDAAANPAQTEPVTLLLNKPVGFHTLPADHPAHHDRHAAQLLSIETLWAAENSSVPPRLRPLKMHFSQLTACAPLETRATGLLVFSQDWRIVRKLTEEANTVEHEIIVEVGGDLAGNQTASGLERLNRGAPFNGRTPTSIKISWQNETHLRIALKGAQLGQVEKLCAAVDLQILAMKRIRLGGVSMGKMPLGQWRYLRSNEKF
jgi:23S rRNA pseudouridine2604 synthase